MSSISRVSTYLVFSSILLSFFPGLILSAVVTLDSIKIYKTHEWLNRKPTVYFQCKGENKTILPDVKGVNVSYSFNGQESWQPLTDFTGPKCKRCGFYEKDKLSPDDIFDEWEFCPTQFEDSKGIYNRVWEHEFDALFLCPECFPLKEAVPHKKEKGMPIALVVVISLLVTVIVALAIVAIYKYWQKKKREQDQARFLKLFEDGDELEDELELGNEL